MLEELNKEWMDEYEKSYSLYKTEWDIHYNAVKNFILSCLPMRVNHWAFIGVTNTIPEIDDKILNRVANISLLDINQEALKRARIHLNFVYEFKFVEVHIFDNTMGYVSKICEEFEKFEQGDLSEKKLFDSLSKFKIPELKYEGDTYNLVTHLGTMDYYLMPLFSKFCSKFTKNYETFFEIMRKLNDDCVKISLQILEKMINKTGQLIISTPVERIPKGEKCKRSLFWLKSIEEHIESTGLVVDKKTTHHWDEYPTKDGHSHTILNICCKKE
jgi:hypothetical protein